jgi:alkanesulfonate monooxygenase SsuD/methylene tetrahydromethanopterin reductase-like flavin-dependent oxidoreductase (luciferase family)
MKAAQFQPAAQTANATTTTLQQQTGAQTRQHAAQHAATQESLKHAAMAHAVQAKTTTPARKTADTIKIKIFSNSFSFFPIYVLYRQ